MIRILKLFLFSLISFVISCDNEPYEGPLNFDTTLTCEEATEALQIAQENFDTKSAINYTSLCEDYKNAIENYLLVCPQEDNQIDMTLNDLGNCELTSFFQVDFDGSTFFADTAEAISDEGVITITGIKDSFNEKVELIFEANSPGVYLIDTQDMGNYSPDDQSINMWQTINNPNNTQGSITITNIDYFNASISGRFNFIAYNDSGEVKEFSNGIFENIHLAKADEFFAKVDGTEFADIQIVPGINNFGWIGLLARDTNNAEFFLAIRYNATPGNYSLSQNASFTRFDYSPNFENFHYGDGIMTILEHNPETNLLIGTFSCTAEPHLGGVGTYEITEGRFCVTYLDGAFDDD